MAVPIMANSNMTPMMPPMMLPVVGPFSGRRLPGEIGRRKKIKPLDKIRRGRDCESPFYSIAPHFNTLVHVMLLLISPVGYRIMIQCCFAVKLQKPFNHGGESEFSGESIVYKLQPLSLAQNEERISMTVCDGNTNEQFSKNTLICEFKFFLPWYESL